MQGFIILCTFRKYGNRTGVRTADLEHKRHPRCQLSQNYISKIEMFYYICFCRISFFQAACRSFNAYNVVAAGRT